MNREWWCDRFEVTTEEIRWVIKGQFRSLSERYSEDLVSEVFAHLIRTNAKKPEFFSDKDGLLAFAKAHAQFVRREFFRQMGRRKIFYFADLQDSQFEDPSERPERDELLSRLADCEKAVLLLSNTNTAVREAFRLKCEGMKGKDIAEKLGVSGPTVSRRLATAYEVLRNELS